MDTTSQQENIPLLLLLDGVLSQDEEKTGIALQQIEKLDPTFQYLQSINSGSITGPGLEYNSPLRSPSALEGIIERLLTIKPHMARVASEIDGSLPLHFAASIGNIRVAALLLNYNRDAALTHNTKGKTPLHYAAREGQVEMVRFLLRLVPLCAAILTKKGKLALHFASGEGHTEVARDLLRVYPSGATIPSKKGKVALHFAARWGHINIARDLCHIYPACIHTLDYDGSNPLHDATREGQFEMIKFLVERYPTLMHHANIRGEIPLFAAIRSGNIALCAFLIQSWPGSGNQVLQAISDPDDISSWEPAILYFCLRGAVGNFTDLTSEERGYTDDPTRNLIERIFNNNAVTNFSHKLYHQFSDRCTDDVNHRQKETSLDVESGFNYYDTQERLHPDLLRSKSPILESDNGRKKRTSMDVTKCSKRQCNGYMDNYEEDSEKTYTHSLYLNTLERNTFYQVHSALQCSATTNVLECVLERYPEQLSVHDDYGRLPLHIAISHCRSNGSVDFILERIWKPHQEACFNRDSFGWLPLHLALMTRADFRLVSVLLDAHPSSALTECQVVDKKFTHMLPIHIAMSRGCDLSTLFLLLRRDPTIVQTWKNT